MLNLYLNEPQKFEIESKNIKLLMYNMPLIEGTERIRLNYYKYLFANYTIFLNENQKNYILKKINHLEQNEIKQINIFKKKYENVKSGIKLFEEIIPEKYFSEVKLDEYTFNLKIFVFLLYLTKISYRLSDNESIFLL